MPPEAAFEKICDLLNQQADDVTGDSLHVLNQYEIAPPADILLLIEQDIFERREDSLASFASLQSYEVAPPVNQFEKIVEKAFVVNKKNSVSTPALVVSIFYRYRAVAAILLVALATWGVYSLLNKSAVKEDAIVLEPGKKQPTVHTTDDTTAAVAVIEDPVNKVTDKTYPVIYSAKVYKAENVFYSESVSVDEYSIPVIHNDLMATFTSFSPDKLPSFITDDKEESTAIKVDGYTSISVSSAMKAMFKKMYKTKRNGKPTRKARKQKAKLERWKKADSIQFDNTLGHNPLDPLDLADFIFK